MLLSATALILFGLSSYLNPALGLKQPSLFDNFWAMEAIVIGLSIILGFIQPYFRGIKVGDTLIATIPIRQHSGTQQIDMLSGISVIALESGRVGKKIRVQMDPARKGEGIITAYSGTFSPATIRLTETER